MQYVFGRHRARGAQVARLQQAGATAAPKPRELNDGERARLAELRTRRLADLVLKPCLSVLRSVQQHPVRVLRGAVACQGDERLST